MKNRFTKAMTAALAVCLVSSTMNDSQNNLHGQQTYQLPPQEVVDIIDAKPVPAISLSPDRKWMLMVERPAMPSIADLSRRMLRLAGMRIDPAANSRFSTSYNTGLSLRPLESDTSVRVPLPEGGKLAGVVWSHLADRFAFIVVTEDGQQLWTATTENPGNPVLLTDQLSTVLGGVEWTPDGQSICAS